MSQTLFWANRRACSSSSRVWRRGCARGSLPGLGLTSDDGRDLVPADPYLVPDLADEGGVDRVVHLQHLELVFVPQHRVWENPRHPAGGGEQRGVVKKVEKWTNNNKKKKKETQAAMTIG